MAILRTARWFIITFAILEYRFPILRSIKKICQPDSSRCIMADYDNEEIKNRIRQRQKSGPQISQGLPTEPLGAKTIATSGICSIRSVLHVTEKILKSNLGKRTRSSVYTSGVFNCGMKSNINRDRARSCEQLLRFRDEKKIDEFLRMPL